MTTLKEHLHNNVKNIHEQQINEFLLTTIVAASILAYCCQPLLKTEFATQIGGGLGMMFGGIGRLLGHRTDKEIEDKRERRAEKEKRKIEKEEAKRKAKEQEQYLKLIAMAQKQISKDKKATDDQKELANNILAASMDKEGKLLPFDTIKDNLKEITGEDPKKYLEDKGIKTMSKDEFEKAGEELKEKTEDISEEDQEELIEYAHTESEEIKKKLDNAEEVEAKEVDDKEEKDEDGNIVKDEEVTDPDTGKKIKVKTHTGPRGGKFYYPEGKPKIPKNKVYVKESLQDYLKTMIK